MACPHLALLFHFKMEVTLFVIVSVIDREHLFIGTVLIHGRRSLTSTSPKS